MYTDLYGNKRQKVGLHIHTTVSDGKETPRAALELYKEKGYDAIAFTDHWAYGKADEIDGITVISGAEYNYGESASEEGVVHILGLFAKDDPNIPRDATPQEMIDAIHAAGGIAVLAHPAWSLNTLDMVRDMHGIDATEIYNAVSEAGESFRPDSSLIVDILASRGIKFPLLATDDTHYYDDIDNGKGFIMVESDDNSPEKLKKAILEERFYASQGPEIHLYRDGDKFCVDCSPVSHIYFASNFVWAPRTAHGNGLTHAEYVPRKGEKFIRAFAVDENGKSAWTNIVML